MGAVVSIVFAIWVTFNAQDHYSVTTTNMSTLDTKVKQYIFELKYHENSDKSGVEMFEIKITAYTGVNKDKVHSYGIQLINPDITNDTVRTGTGGFNIWEWKNDLEFTHKVNFNETKIAYFNSDNNVSYGATTALNTNNTPYIIDIDGELYAFDFNKRYLVDTNTDFFALKQNKYYNSSFEYFVFKMYNGMSTLTNGEGIYDNLNVNLNDVFNIYSYNETTKKFDALSDLGYNAEYMGVRITYVERGARIHSDSLFGQVGNQQIGGVIYE